MDHDLRAAVRRARHALACLLWTAAPALALPIQFPSFDLQATGIEVVQSVQNAANDVRLVELKPTLVRVYATHTSSDDLQFFPLVRTRLAATRIAPGPAQQLGTLEALSFVSDSELLSRNSLGNSANFQIPASWRSGTVQFTATVDSDNKYVEQNGANNVAQATVEFVTVPPLRLRIYQIQDASSGLPTAADLSLLNSWLRRAFPTATVDVEYRTNFSTVDLSGDVCNCQRVCADPMTPGSCTGNPMAACFSDSQCGAFGSCNCSKGGCESAGTCQNDPLYACTASTECGCGRINDWLAAQRAIDQSLDPGFDPDRRYVGLVSDKGGFMRGCSPGVTLKVASGPTGDPDGQSFADWDTDASYGDWYTGHELGHAFGLDHWTCCGAFANNPKEPYPMCELSSANEHIGVDLAYPRLYRDSTYTDLMAYCDYQWTSDVTYDDILDQLIAENGAPPPTPQPPGDKLLVQGQVDIGLALARIGQVTTIAASTTEASAGDRGDFELRIQDSTGRFISHFFTPSEVFDDHNFGPSEDGRNFDGIERTAVFAELLDVPEAGVAGIALYEGGVLRDQRMPSATPPTVKLTYPDGGETLPADLVTVTWDASDDDGDALTATLLYSADAGASWQSVAAGILGSEAEVDVSVLAAGSSSLFRVLVSDGFHTASDTSDAVLEITDAPPLVTIVTPADTATAPTAQTVVLEADVFDATDGMLTGASIHWSSDRQGALGQGSSLAVDGFVPGTHAITATATDSGGNMASDSISLLVGEASIADACPAVPRRDCDTAGSAGIAFKDSSSPDKAGLLVRMRRTLASHEGGVFGRPDLDTSHSLCLYEDARLQAAFALPVGEGWSPLRRGKGFRYTNGDGSVVLAALKAGPLGEARPATIAIRIRGAEALALDPPMEVPMTVQLVNDTGSECFEASWSDLPRNEVGRLRAR